MIGIQSKASKLLLAMALSATTAAVAATTPANAPSAPVKPSTAAADHTAPKPGPTTHSPRRHRRHHTTSKSTKTSSATKPSNPKP